MKCYEIYSNGLKLLIYTEILDLNKKMSKLFNGYFVFNNYDEGKAPNAIVKINIIRKKPSKENIVYIMSGETYIYSEKPNEINFVYSNKFDKSQCLNLKRIVTDTFCKYYESIGVYFIHAAAVVNKLDKKATIFLGSKYSGKTTNLLFYLSSGKYNFMGEHRIGLMYIDGKLFALGFPSNLGIRISTLELNKDLKEKLYNYIDFSSCIEKGDSKLSSKFALNLYDLLDAFNCSAVSKAEVSKIIITRYESSLNHHSFCKISNAAMKSEIISHHISSISEQQVFLNKILLFRDCNSIFDINNLKCSAYTESRNFENNQNFIS